MIKYSNDSILKGIKDRDRNVNEYVYQTYFPLIRNFIEQNSGNKDDARDVFQDALASIYLKLHKKHINLVCEFGTYLYSVCRYNWLTELKRNRKEEERNEKYRYTEMLEQVPDEVDPEIEKYVLYRKHLKRLSKKCREILKLYFNKVPFTEITRKMGLINNAQARKVKFRCKEKLLKSIRLDPEYLALTKTESHEK